MPTVLIVEDEALLRGTYRFVLEAEDYDVVEASDGQQALQQLESHKPDVILLDINMPNMDGITFLKQANLDTLLPKTRVIVFSNLEETDRLNEAYKLGAVRYVLKASVSPKELVALVGSVVK